jgi:hypothetical protein
MSLLVEKLTQFRSVYEVSIVRQTYAIGAVDVEWLSFSTLEESAITHFEKVKSMEKSIWTASVVGWKADLRHWCQL